MSKIKTPKVFNEEYQIAFTSSDDNTVYLMTPENEIDYIATITGKKIDLKRSDASHWSAHVKGETIAKLRDTGDGIKIKGLVDLSLEYHEFWELYQLMKLKADSDPNL